MAEKIMLTLAEAEQRGRSGSAADVDFLMGNLTSEEELVTCKLVDYGLGLVATREGRVRLHHFLFHGNLIQRNYAALYFKRREWTDVLDEAVRCGCIDEAQAYSK
jgi:hypothetical protein